MSFGGHGGPGAGRHRPRTRRTPGAVVHLRRAGPDGSSFPLHELAGLSPARRAADVETAPRHPLLRGVAGDASRRPHCSWTSWRRRAREDAPDEVRRGEAEQLEARRRHDVWDTLGRVTCPTFVAAGRFDGIAPVANSDAIVSTDGGCVAARLRGRPRILRAGPAGPARGHRASWGRDGHGDAALASAKSATIRPSSSPLSSGTKCPAPRMVGCACPAAPGTVSRSTVSHPRVAGSPSE